MLVRVYISEHKLASDYVKVEHWCFFSKMVLNIKKNKTMLITTYQKLHKLLVKNINITVNNQALEDVTSEKLLGVVVDQNLTWKGHVDKFCGIVRILSSKLRHIKHFLLTDDCIKYCQAFIFTHIDYCSTVWGSSQLQRLYKLQKRAARMIFDLSTQTPSKPLLEKLNWMSVMDRAEYR